MVTTPDCYAGGRRFESQRTQYGGRLSEAGKPLVPEVIALALGFRCTRSSQSVQIAGSCEVAVQIARG